MTSPFGKKTDYSGSRERRTKRSLDGSKPGALFGSPRIVNCYSCDAEVIESRAVVRPEGAKPGDNRTLHCTRKCAGLPELPEGVATEGEPWQD